MKKSNKWVSLKIKEFFKTTKKEKIQAINKLGYAFGILSSSDKILCFSMFAITDIAVVDNTIYILTKRPVELVGIGKIRIGELIKLTEMEISVIEDTNSPTALLYDKYNETIFLDEGM